MNQEEMKSELATEIELRDISQAFTDTHIRRVATLELDLAEAEKPELQNGAYGINSNGLKFVVIKDKIHWGKSGNTGPLPNDTVKSKHVIDNIWKEMKALSKRLTYFKADVHEYTFDFTGHTGAPVLIAGNWHTLKEAKQISLDLQRLVRTAAMEAAK